MKNRITKVTTKRGDDGTTSSADGSRLSKSDNLIKTIGNLDELNSWIGLLVTLEELNREKVFLQKIQNSIFDIGGILSSNSDNPLNRSKIKDLEDRTKQINKNLPPLKNFVLPGGNKESSLIHISRTVCRRAERSLVEAAKTNKVEKNCLAYLNRLSDFLFVLARKIQRDLGSEETLWSQD